MAIYIDPPLWPAHGTLWSHVISDSALDELHTFAQMLSVPQRSFDLDHVDLPAARYDAAVHAGAIPVSANELVRILQRSGLRIRTRDRARHRPTARLQYLTREWGHLSESFSLGHTREWEMLGQDLLSRWAEPHRRYHDLTHLEDVLLALDHLRTLGETVTPETLLAAWFHDAVCRGEPGEDERASALLALQTLSQFPLDPSLPQQVHDAVLMTIPSSAGANPSQAIAHLLDADLAIFGAGSRRYLQYTEHVRAEYAHVPDSQFRTARKRILERYLADEYIYRTSAARHLWEATARRNLEAEIQTLT